jgi:hypothetical protein
MLSTVLPGIAEEMAALAEMAQTGQADIGSVLHSTQCCHFFICKLLNDLFVINCGSPVGESPVVSIVTKRVHCASVLR